MEGGTRLGRASSRYCLTQPPPVFDGPVRKWKKQWVSSQSSNSDGHGGKRNNNTPPLLLCRWIPLSSTATADTVNPDQPPKRRFRYTPTVPIKKEKKEVQEKVCNEGRTSKENESKANANIGSDIFENPSIGDVFKEESQEMSEGQSDSNRSLDDEEEN
ncbi:unnamed protein product [Fraxinus pennsylvanica]|uniref:Uncharacterized protein n=1 Tax=Fraxinus pennsylvanica TaxID=56036 RepID=A0AAD2DKU6_9LAMI|nr:unnamed protein product [Fraxinus pennsylvanica]